MQSGSPPLYRINLVVLFISAVIQAALGDAPQSVSEKTSGDYFDWFFIGMQFIASVMIIAALYMEDGSSLHASRLRHSLATEFVGLCFLQTVMIVNVVAVMFFQQGPPSAPATWLMIGFSMWAWWRMKDCLVAIRELT